MLYYLFSAHHWGLNDLKALWEGETGWHDLIFTLSSHEVGQRAELGQVKRPGPVKVTRKRE